MRAVITAGGPIDGEYAALAGTDRKALAEVRGKTMLARAIDALRSCGIDAIAVVGNDAVARECASVAPVTMVRDAGSGEGNVLGALAAWPDDESLLYLTCDLPYLDARSLRWFVDRIEPQTLSMPLCEYALYEQRFPGAAPAGITLGGERVVNAGAFHLPAGSGARLRSVAAALFTARKAPWRMARIAGFATLLRFASGRLTIAALEARAHRVLELPVAALRGAPPELAYDADTAADYRYARAHP